jgi:hypothetical protein
VISKIIMGNTPKEFYLQSRLLMSNRSTLNPNSPLVIIRYDLVPANLEKNYEFAMHKFISQLKIDPAKAAKYKNDLHKLWNK